MKQVAVITGASRGVGRALALGFLRDGYRVVAIARSLDRLSTLAKEASVPESDVFPISIDLTNIPEIPRALKAIPGNFGDFSVLVNNAGALTLGTLGVEASDFKLLMDTNVTAPFAVLRELVPLLKNRGKGHVFNVASRAGKIGFSQLGGYCATKFALVGMGESLYRELAPLGINVTTLCPSWIDTDMAQEGGTPLSGEKMIQPDDLMKTVRWVMSLSPAACVREVMIECRADIR
jgi:3-oxoacyl-[acyl-carrier protein] reductase